MRFGFRLLHLAFIGSIAAAHFILQIPSSIGFDDVNEITSPCGGFDINNRDKVTEWPVNGHPVGVVSTHPNARWQIRAALLEKPDEFIDLIPDLLQDGMGNFCLESVPGYTEWVGKDAVFQMIQTAVDGQLYQCAAIQFVTGPAVVAQGNCRNASNVSASVHPDYSGTPISAPAPTSELSSDSDSPSVDSTESTVPTATGSSKASKGGAQLPFLGVIAMMTIALGHFSL